MKYIDDIELELVNNIYKVKLINCTFYKYFKQLFDKDYIDCKKKIITDFKEFQYNNQIRHSKFLTAKEAYRHLKIK